MDFKKSLVWKKPQRCLSKAFFLFAGNAQQHSQRKEEGKGEKKSLALAPRKAIEEDEKNLLSFLHSVSELSLAGELIENGASFSFPPVGFLGGLNYVEGRERGKKKTSLFGRVGKERRWKGSFFASLAWVHHYVSPERPLEKYFRLNFSYSWYNS